MAAQPASARLSLSSTGVGIHGALSDYVEHIKDEALIIVQIETRGAVGRAEDLLMLSITHTKQECAMNAEETLFMICF